MESQAVLPLTHLSLFPPKSNRSTAYLSGWPCKRRSSQPTRLHCQKMFVPGFGEASPEAKAANNLHNFFTYIAVKIVSAQLEVPPLSLVLPSISSLLDTLNYLHLENCLVIKDCICCKTVTMPIRIISCVNIYLAEQSYNPEAYEELMEFLSRHSLNDGDKFCANLMRESSRHKSLALRILEVRSAYCERDFEWDNFKRLAFKMVSESNTRLMRDYVLETSPAENEK